MVKESSNKLLFPDTAQALEEEYLEPDDTPPLLNHHSDKFLYVVTTQLSKEKQDSQMVINEDPEP